MDALLSPKPASSSHDILCLRKIYDAVDVHTRTLVPFNINMDHYGTMLVSVLLNKLLKDFKIEIWRHMPADQWKLKKFCLFSHGNDFQVFFEVLKITAVVNILHQFYYLIEIKKHKLKLVALIVE